MRDVVRTLEGFRETGFLVGFKIESPNLDHPYIGINQKTDDQNIVHTEQVNYSYEPSSPIWGNVQFMFAAEEIKKLRSDLTSQMLGPTLVAAAGIAIVVTLIGFLFGLYNDHLFSILERELIKRSSNNYSKNLNFVFSPVLTIAIDIRKKLELLEQDRQSYIANMATYRAARQIAHDIKGPLTFLRFFSRRMEVISAEDSKNLNLVADRLEKMGLHILKENHSSNLDSISLIALVKKVEGFVAYKATEIRDYVISFHYESHNNSDFFLQIDYNLLERVLDNLISNAVEATSGPYRKELRVQLRTIEDCIQIEINDFGPGMSKSAINAFNSQTSGFTTKLNGHGIGLPFCKQVIEQMNGKLTYAYDDASGSKFFIWLPLKI
ncbi:MAG: sensor histidine kinase [Bdellovibrionales bacterium]